MKARCPAANAPGRNPRSCQGVFYLLITPGLRDWMMTSPIGVPFSVVKRLKCPKFRAT
jgi:hypothetical protein